MDEHIISAASKLIEAKVLSN